VEDRVVKEALADYFLAVTVEGDLKDEAFHRGIAALQNLFEILRVFQGTELGQEAEPSPVDAEDRLPGAAKETGGPEKRTVAADDNDQVGSIDKLVPRYCQAVKRLSAYDVILGEINPDTLSFQEFDEVPSRGMELSSSGRKFIDAVCIIFCTVNRVTIPAPGMTVN